ncbi:MAG: hypothetical protein C4547_07690, partial [Phycisphaerales bacterium]
MGADSFGVFSALRSLAWVVTLAACVGPAGASDYQVLSDRAGDTRILRTDPGGDGPVNPDAHRLPDLLSISVGTWQPDEPDGVDPFIGHWDRDADEPFLRVDLRFAGLLNPPGFTKVDSKFDYDPFEFGPHPVFGYIEFDVDRNVDTGGEGGESDSPHIRFLGVGARFGGLPANLPRALYDRFALDAGAFDRRCDEEPLVRRSGEEFHLALFRKNYRNHIEVKKVGEDPRKFTEDEIWILYGEWLHRAHG